MKKAKRKRTGGRKPTGKTPIIALRLSPPLTARLDAWAARKGYSRSDAIRAMIENGLAHPPMEPGKPHKGAAKAKDMAKVVLNDRLKGLPEEERVMRKGRLLKGPAG
jgi:hypothetical protein